MRQLQLIEKVRQQSLQNEDISAVLMYGSFTKGEGDQYSDIEFYIYYRTKECPDKLGLISQIAPVLLFFTNEFGTDVAVFENMIRGEFHFHPVSDIEDIRAWPKVISFEFKDKMNLMDKDGTLSAVLDSIPPIRPERYTSENREYLACNLINNLIFENNLILRGEYAHAHQLFGFIQRYILWLMRLYLKKDNHWEAPTKKLEEDIPHEWYLKYEQCIPTLDKESLQESFKSAVELTDFLFSGLDIPENIHTILRRL
ncbi:lincosamide nucleotidyltransferase [Dysgonomonas hofstadii]|uniref:Lincosamide nucleotidyltransferase n=1 Tax=Dysgonomonas hofstadii TaxID=637886 RepID=A0A840CI16_9BACT|nr:LinF [Dysgonomonas hofstadii]MBB4034851.1 lincosamide nucleotidyltransferase [Dysgonomonas hofstadii]